MDHEIEKKELKLKKKKQETYIVAKFYNEFDFIMQYKRKETTLKNTTLNLKISQHLQQKLAKLKEFELQRK